MESEERRQKIDHSSKSRSGRGWMRNKVVVTLHTTESTSVRPCCTISSIFTLDSEWPKEQDYVVHTSNVNDTIFIKMFYAVLRTTKTYIL